MIQYIFIFYPGFIGDRVGYRWVLVVSMVITALFGTFLDLTPRFSVDVKAPTATLFKAHDDPSFQLVSVEWPLCHMDTLTDSDCEDSLLLLNDFENITSYLSCDEPISLLDEDFELFSPNVTESANGTFCRAESDFEPDYLNGSYVTHCRLVGYPRAERCETKHGSHATTFWVNFAIRTVYMWTMNSAYTILDSTSVALAKDHNSDYSHVIVWFQLSGALGAFVAGFVIQDPEDGGG